jgi:hypothetical protein
VIDHLLSLLDRHGAIDVAVVVAFVVQVSLQQIQQFGHLREDQNFVMAFVEPSEESIQEFEFPRDEMEQGRVDVREVLPSRGVSRLTEEKRMVANFAELHHRVGEIHQRVGVDREGNQSLAELPRENTFVILGLQRSEGAIHHDLRWL